MAVGDVEAAGSERVVGKTPLSEAARSVWKIVLPTSAFSLAINLLLFVSPIYMMQIYDRVLTSRSESTLVSITVMAVFLIGLMGTLEWVRSRVLVRVGMAFDEALGPRLFDAAGEAEIKSPQAGAAQFLGDADRIREFVTGTAIINFIDAPWTPLFVILCFLLHPWIGALVLGGAIIVLLLALASEIVTKSAMDEASSASRGLSVDTAVAFRNIEAVHALGMRNSIRRRWISSRVSLLARQAALSDKAGTIAAVSKFVRVTLQSAVLGLGAWLAIRNELSPGAMIAASMLMGRAMAPIDMAIANWKGFVAARASYRRLSALFSAHPSVPREFGIPLPKGRVSVSNLTVSPPGSNVPTIKGVSFAVEPGEVVAVVGPSAAGKSTLVRALVGVWKPSDGSIRIDGYELDQWEPDALGSRIGYLPQDVDLFNDTLARNISRFTEGRDAEVIEAARMAEIHETIQRYPDGYATRVGQGGLILSGGQRQRLALARALFGRPTLLVLDEPNSNLDNHGEQALLIALRRAKEAGATIIVTTHKPSLLAVADKVLVLVDGAVHQFGPRDEIVPSITGGRPPSAADRKEGSSQ